MVRVDARSEPGGGAVRSRRPAQGRTGARRTAPTEETLTAANDPALYGVDADVQFHPRAGHLTVVPIAPIALTRSPASGRARPSGSACCRTFGGASARLRGGAAARAARRQHAHSPRHGLRPLDSVRRQRRRADLLHRPAAARARRGARRQRAGAGGRRLSGAAAQSARLARHARRVGRRVARRDARDHLPPRLLAARHVGGAARQLRRLARRAGHRLRAVDGAPPRHVDDGAAARRRDADGVAVGGDRVRAVPRRLHRDVPQRAVADGIARRRHRTRRSSRRCCRWRSRGPASRRCRACSI